MNLKSYLIHMEHIYWEHIYRTHIGNICIGNTYQVVREEGFDAPEVIPDIYGGCSLYVCSLCICALYMCSLFSEPEGMPDIYGGIV
jgi:hypothetical protein